MKTEQIRLVKEIAECESITMAARKLFMTQPNACHMLDVLEEELGYRLFERSRKGTKLTQNGAEFMKYVETLNRTFANIDAIGTRLSTIQFTVLAYAYDFCEIAFLKLCKEQLRTENRIQIKMLEVDSLWTSIEKLNHGEAEVAMGICRVDIFDAFQKKIKEYDIVTDYLTTMPLHITTSINHPLASESEIHIKDYLQYPCLTSIGQDTLDNYASFSLMEFLPFIKKVIYCNPGETRRRILQEENGFVISTPLPPEERRKYHLIGKSLPDSELIFFTLYCKEQRENPLIVRYVELLKQEIVKYDEERTL